MHKHFNPFDLTNEELIEMAPEQQKIDIYETDPFTQYVGTSFDPGYKPQVYGDPINSEFKLPGFNEDSHHSVPEIESRFNKELRTQEMYDKYIKDFGSQYIYGSNETDSSRSKLHQLLAGVDNMALQYGMTQNQVDQLKAKIMQSHLFDHLSEKQVRDELSISIPGNVKPTQRPLEFETPRKPVATGAGLPTEDEMEAGAAANPVRGEKSKIPLNRNISQGMLDEFVTKLKDHSGTVEYIGQHFTQHDGKGGRKPVTTKFMASKLKGVLRSKDKAIQQIVLLIEQTSPQGDIQFGTNISDKEERIIRFFLKYAIGELRFAGNLRGNQGATSATEGPPDENILPKESPGGTGGPSGGAQLAH